MAESEDIKMNDPLANLPQPQLPASAPDLSIPALAPAPDTAPAQAPSPAPAQALAPTPAQAQVPTPVPVPALAPDALNPNHPFDLGLPDNLMHKNRLQEYAQRASLPLPIYQTLNEGQPHAPKFRSTVLVDGSTYTSLSTFAHRKAAEQDVAKLALELITKKIRNEGCPLIREDTVFCKSILNEYAVKMNLAKPTYSTIKTEALLPVFVSALVFDGVTHIGDTGRTKKEAEQLAARAVILSILGSSGSGTVLSEIIKSKNKLYAALHKVKDSEYAHHGFVPVGVNTGHSSGITINNDKEVESAGFTSTVPTSAIPEASSGMNLPHHTFKMPKPEPSPEAINLPIAFVHPCSGQPLGDDPNSSKKRRKNKRRPNKKLRTDAESPIAAVPLSQAPPCSVAQ